MFTSRVARFEEKGIGLIMSHRGLSTFNLDAYPLSFHILANTFALSKNSTLFFSIDSALFGKNTGGGVPPQQ